MQFHCEICNVSFKAKQTLERHLQSTRHLAVLYDKDNEFHFVCECGKKYVHKQSLVLHQKTCKHIQSTKQNTFCISTDEFQALKDKCELLDNRLTLLQNNTANTDSSSKDNTGGDVATSIHGNHNRSNTTNNKNTTININAFGSENLDYITERVIANCITRGYECIPEIIKKIHFDKNHPENHNIKIPNKKMSHALVKTEENKWKTMNRKHACEDMVNSGYLKLDEGYQESRKFLSPTQKNRFESIQREMDDETRNQKLIDRYTQTVDMLILDSTRT